MHIVHGTQQEGSENSSPHIEAITDQSFGVWNHNQSENTVGETTTPTPLLCSQTQGDHRAEALEFSLRCNVRQPRKYKLTVWFVLLASAHWLSLSIILFAARLRLLHAHRYSIWKIFGKIPETLSRQAALIQVPVKNEIHSFFVLFFLVRVELSQTNGLWD